MQPSEHPHGMDNRLSNTKSHGPAIRRKRRKAVSLVEILVAIAIIGLLIAIEVPVLRKLRLDSQSVRGMNNLRQIVGTVSCFALDNHDKFPESVATIGLLSQFWNWQEPTMLTAYQKQCPSMARAMSTYLRSYLKDASVLFCPNAPNKYEYLQNAWDAGDGWDNPKTAPPQDPMIGTYCVYWNYIGVLEQQKEPFKGPRYSSGGRGRSKLLVSDYFGYGHWRNKLHYGNCKAYGSCEKFKWASITPGTEVSSDFWSVRAEDEQAGLHNIRIKFHAGYTDGHVEHYSASEVVPMKVSKTPDGSVPYPDELGPGIFYLPENALE